MFWHSQAPIFRILTRESLHSLRTLSLILLVRFDNGFLFFDKNIGFDVIFQLMTFC